MGFFCFCLNVVQPCTLRGALVFQKNEVWRCSNLKNWNFGIFAIFFNVDKDLARSSKLEFFDRVGHMGIILEQIPAQIPRFQLFGTNSNPVGILEF